MTTSTVKYRFIRNLASVSGFFSQNRASTDAHNALIKWRQMEKGRNFEVELDDDKQLIAVLTFESLDRTAGSQMDALCEEYGVHPQAIN